MDPPLPKDRRVELAESTRRPVISGVTYHATLGVGAVRPLAIIRRRRQSRRRPRPASTPRTRLALFDQGSDLRAGAIGLLAAARRRRYPDTITKPNLSAASMSRRGGTCCTGSRAATGSDRADRNAQDVDAAPYAAGCVIEGPFDLVGSATPHLVGTSSLSNCRRKRALDSAAPG